MAVAVCSSAMHLLVPLQGARLSAMLAGTHAKRRAVHPLLPAAVPSHQAQLQRGLLPRWEARRGGHHLHCQMFA